MSRAPRNIYSVCLRLDGVFIELDGPTFLNFGLQGLTCVLFQEPLPFIRVRTLFAGVVRVYIRLLLCLSLCVSTPVGAGVDWVSMPG